MAQLVERIYGIDEVVGSNPTGSTNKLGGVFRIRQGAALEMRWVSTHVGSSPTPSAHALDS